MLYRSGPSRTILPVFEMSDRVERHETPVAQALLTMFPVQFNICLFKIAL
jgi:hypothetical protein